MCYNDRLYNNDQTGNLSEQVPDYITRTPNNRSTNNTDYDGAAIV